MSFHQADPVLVAAAIRGERVPNRLTRDQPVARWAVIAGIRANDAFGSELRDSGDEVFIRALNARAIMSNRVPDMPTLAHIPYCFWHPDLPSEATLRSLLEKYPFALMRYQVGRACAAAGYYDLYSKLDILPDVAHAEEARDNGDVSKAIFDHIMSAPVLYSVMDDYELNLKHPPVAHAVLNGDTCVRYLLDRRMPTDGKALFHDFEHYHLKNPVAFDIAEDRNIGIDQPPPVDDHIIKRLYNPLPTHLPSVDKDLLILMAAWSGDIDRYARLRRPHLILGEDQCLVRGIYHSTFIAKWCCLQPSLAPFRKYAHARFTMINDLTWLTDSTPERDLPEMMWYPDRAASATLEKIVRRRPSMRFFVARTCIIIGDWSLFERLDPMPNARLYAGTFGDSDTRFRELIERRAAELSVDLRMPINDVVEGAECFDDDIGRPPAHMFLVAQEMGNRGTGRGNTVGFPCVLSPQQVGYYRVNSSGEDHPQQDINGVMLRVAAHGSGLSVPDGFDWLNVAEYYQDAPYVSEEVRPLVGLYPNRARPRGGYRGVAWRHANGSGRGGGRGG